MGLCASGLGHTNHPIGRFNGGTAQTNHNELRFGGLLFYHFGQALHVRPIQEHIHLVEGIERRGAVALKGKNETEGRQGFFAAGHGSQPLHRFALGMGDQVEAAF